MQLTEGLEELVTRLGRVMTRAGQARAEKAEERGEMKASTKWSC